MFIPTVTLESRTHQTTYNSDVYIASYHSKCVICLLFQLREDFDCGKDISLGEDHCPHDVATLLKEFFRDLPEPLLSRDLYQAFVQTQSKNQE